MEPIISVGTTHRNAWCATARAFSHTFIYWDYVCSKCL